MANNHKRSILWLGIFIVFIMGISYLTVTFIDTSQSILLNTATISCLVSGILLLSLFVCMHNREYAYPVWCVAFMITVMSVISQLCIKYWNPLLTHIIDKKYTSLLLSEPFRDYSLIAWVFLCILLIIIICRLLLRFMKPFIVFGFYELSTLPIIIVLSMWIIGLDIYYSPQLLQILTIKLATQLTIQELGFWSLNLLLIIFIIIKIIIVMLYQDRWLTNIQHLLWIILTIWVVLLIANKIIASFYVLIEAYIGSVGILIGYYLLTIIVTVIVFKLFFKQKYKIKYY